MEKDYVPSVKYNQQTIQHFDVPYMYQDFCLNEYIELQQCYRQHPKVFEIPPFTLTPLNKCGALKKVWTKCQEYREREIYDEMRKMYLENIKL